MLLIILIYCAHSSGWIILACDFLCETIEPRWFKQNRHVGWVRLLQCSRHFTKCIWNWHQESVSIDWIEPSGENTFINPFAAVLTSSARHELSEPHVPLWRAPLVIQVTAYWLCVALQALISWRNLGTWNTCSDFGLHMGYWCACYWMLFMLTPTMGNPVAVLVLNIVESGVDGCYW